MTLPPPAAPVRQPARRRALLLALALSAALPVQHACWADNAGAGGNAASTSSAGSATPAGAGSGAPAPGAETAQPGAGNAGNGAANGMGNGAGSSAGNGAGNGTGNGAGSGAFTGATPGATAVQNGGAGATNGTAGRQVRFGGSVAAFRRLIPSPTLEAQAAAEYGEIVRGAAHSDRLYPDSDPHVQRVRTLVDRLVPYSLKWSDRVKNWKWEIAVIRSPDIRMYCLPGGKIVVYGGLLDRVKLNDNELGMLLGHEIAHAVREHVRERLGEQQAAQIEAGTVPQLFGLADLGVFPLGIGSQLVEMRYGRADETEADVIGSDIASRAGFDPRAALTLWDKLAVATKSDRDQGFIYVHPYTPARRADIVKRLPDMLPLYAKAIGKPLNTLPEYAGIGVPQRRKVSAP